jgi:hypothetical protein
MPKYEQTLSTYELRDLLSRNFVPTERFKAVYTLLFLEEPTPATVEEYEDFIAVAEEDKDSENSYSYSY